MTETIMCQHCGQRPARKKYCSDECKSKGWAANNSEHLKKYNAEWKARNPDYQRKYWEQYKQIPKPKTRGG